MIVDIHSESWHAIVCSTVVHKVQVISNVVGLLVVLRCTQHICPVHKSQAGDLQLKQEALGSIPSGYPGLFSLPAGY